MQKNHSHHPLTHTIHEKIRLLSQKHPWGLALLVVLLVTVLRLLLTTRYPLSPDEAYYWLWSKNLDWFYFSKGPIVAYTIALGTWFGGNTELGVRWPAVILSALSLFLLFYASRRFFSPALSWFCLVAGICTPLFALGSIVMTIDPLSVFFWAAAIVTGWLAWRTNSTAWWSLTGMCVGLGFLSKFTNAIQAICFLCFLLGTSRGRQMLRTPSPWWAATLALLSTLPFWIWNANHDWVNWKHLLSRGQLLTPETQSLFFSIKPMEFLLFVGLQALVISPILWLIILCSIIWAVHKTISSITFFQQKNCTHPEGQEIQLFYLLCQSVPLFLFFGLFALNDAGQPNWTAPGYVAAVVIVGKFLQKMWNKSPLLRLSSICALVLAALSTLILHNTRPLRLPPEIDPLSRIRGWDELCQKILTAQQSYKADFLLANHYGLVSALTWQFTQKNIPTPIFRSQNPGRINDQFSFWPNYFDRTNQNAILIVKMKKNTTRKTPRPPKAIREQFEDWELIDEPFWTKEKDLPIAKYALFYMKKLKKLTDHQPSATLTTHSTPSLTHHTNKP